MSLHLCNISLALHKKGCTPIQVFSVPNAYTDSFVVCSCNIHFYLNELKCVHLNVYTKVYTFKVYTLRQFADEMHNMQEHTTKYLLYALGFRDRKYLNRYMVIFAASL